MKKKDTTPVLGQMSLPQKNNEVLAPKIQPVQGQIEFKYVKCGHTNCHCVSGKGHGPYTYIRRQADGKRARTYIRKEQTEVVIKAASQHKASCEKAHRERHQWKDLLAEIKGAERQHRIAIRNLKGNTDEKRKREA